MSQNNTPTARLNSRDSFESVTTDKVIAGLDEAITEALNEADWDVDINIDEWDIDVDVESLDKEIEEAFKRLEKEEDIKYKLID